ncbi:MAG TPA: hypothetical protein VFZ34_16715 [Blastocatellia bacterium]|nr:hypothetical protein [Blastocatellia bacterium]
MKPLSHFFSALLLVCVCTMVGIAQDNKIPAGAIVFIEPMEGFETYLAAALEKKKVPLVVVSKREEADFEIKGVAEKQKAGWAKTIFGSGLPSASASIQIINVKSGVVAFAVAEERRDANFGQRSVAEYLAKKIGEKMRKDEKPQQK